MKPTSRWTIIHEGERYEELVTLEGARLLVATEAFARATGWKLNDAGLCRGERCVPVRARAAWLDGDAIDLRAVVDLLEMPLELDVDERVIAIGESAVERARLLDTLEAPDFTLPDLAGKPRSLAEFRGRKVLLLAFSSW